MSGVKFPFFGYVFKLENKQSKFEVILKYCKEVQLLNYFPNLPEHFLLIAMF